ncbi:MAG: hypothetical protein GQ567_01820 [Methanosarcinales archaeon]|nr:hypothetical protein [Methanosarcinales archaeon]
MKKIIGIVMALLMLMSVTVALADKAKDVNSEAGVGLTKVTQEKGSHEIESAYDGEQIRIECEFAKPLFEKGEYDKVKVKSLRNLGKPGEPILPFKTLNILLPQGKTVQSIEVTGNQIHLPGEYRVEHGQEPVPVGSKSNCRAPPDPAIYESTNPFPGKMFTKASIQELRGYKILILNLYPVQYIPKAGKISYFENMNVIVNTAPDAISGNFRGLPQDRTRVVLDVVDNPEVVETYSAQPTSIVDSTDSYAYVIITDAGLKDAFQPLASWKSAKGVNTTIVTVENITADPDYDGVDTQEEIRNFIIDAYNNWGITYVLLGGDVEIIPHRNFYVETSPRPRDRYSIPSDLYYAGLDGTWDDDGDGRYGEPGEEDLHAEVYVGRAPVNTADEVSRFVTKTIAYEDNPPADYLKNALMLAAMLNEDTDGADTKNIYICQKIPGDWEIAKIYESNDTQRGSLVELTTAALNAGQHVVNNICHANEDLLALGYVLSDPDELYTISEVDGLENAAKYFLFYTIGCHANAFDYDDCIGEHFVNNDNGAFAFIGNTRYGWYISGQPGNGPSDKFDIEFFDALFVEDITNMGIALQDSKEDLAGDALADPYMRYCYYTLNLLGDPETSLATVPTEPPAPSIIGHAPESPVSDIAGETRTFNITVDQVVNVSWQINGTEVQINAGTTEAYYTNTSAVGSWNVSAIASNPNGTAMQTWIWNVIPPDTTPPASVTDLNVSEVGETWINWTWANPTDTTDFSHVTVYLNGSFETNVSTNYYNATGLNSDTIYEIGTYTVDTSGNINQTWVNDTAKTLAPDTTPPVISNVTASDITSSSAKITWDTDEPADSLVKYGTESGNYTNNVANLTSVISHVIDLAELVPSTKYYYVVNSTDPSGNSAQSLEYNFTTNEAASNTMHVDNISMLLGDRSAGRNTFVWAVATVTILNESGSPVEGATVEGYWSGLTSDFDSETTDTEGHATLNSDSVKNAEGTFNFTVSNVSLTGLTYDPEANEEISNSIDVP